MRSTIAGHFWTLGPHLAASLTRPRGSAGEAFSAEVVDATLGRVRLTGKLEASGERALLVVVHGLGGGADSPYARRAAQAARRRGLACLRLNLRGADRSGEDYYHAGLTADLHAALASPKLACFEDVFVIGYSLGGHMALRFATEELDARVRAVAAVCAPLDLELSARALDRPLLWPYRRHVLSGLKEIYAEVARRRAVPTPLERVRRIASLVEWDELTVAPRHGWRGAVEYYAAASVGPCLGALRQPALLVAATDDPMVPAHTLRPSLRSSPAALDVRFVARGGHVGFPRGLDLGVAAEPGLESQVLGWLVQRA